MSNLPLAKRVWAVDASGMAIESRPRPAELSSGQRHYMYRIGMMTVDAFLKKHGFKSNTTFGGDSGMISVEQVIRGKYVWIDLALKKPDNIAFITSKPGYVYNKDKVNAQVTTAKDIIGGDMLIQLIVSTNDSGGSRNPIYVPLPKSLDRPARYVFDNVLGAISATCENIPIVKEAFTNKSVDEATYSQLEAEAVGLLPESPT